MFLPHVEAILLSVVVVIPKPMALIPLSAVDIIVPHMEANLLSVAVIYVGPLPLIPLSVADTDVPLQVLTTGAVVHLIQDKLSRGVKPINPSRLLTIGRDFFI